MSETVDRLMPTAPARAYAMRAREDQDSLEVMLVHFLFLILKCMH